MAIERVGKSVKTLLVDDDLVRRHDTKVILDFVGEHTFVTDSESLEGFLKSPELNGQVLCVFLGGALDKRTRALEVILNWDEVTPIVLLDNHQDTNLNQIPETFRSSIITCISTPPSYTKLLDTLHRAQIYRDQYGLQKQAGARRDPKLFRSLVGTSRKMDQVRALMAQVADKDVNVLITGESGTGKEVIARNLHYNSSRKDKPFVPINCGAIPAELLESELFGHEKGAFTGAISSRAGRFEIAEGGTLFLDEIGDMPLHMQVKILRVLQEKTFERIGSAKVMTTDVRIIAATHRDLETQIKQDKFREDLYYRLNVFPIEMPPLRERTEDIPLLLNELIARIENEKRGSIRFNEASIMVLCRHHWQGNVRELANLVERLVITHPYSVIGVKDLPKRFCYLDAQDEEVVVEADASQARRVANLSLASVLPVNGLDLKAYLNGLESSLIKQALEETDGVVARAAERLKIRRTTLVEKMKKYQMPRKEA